MAAIRSSLAACLAAAVGVWLLPTALLVPAVQAQANTSYYNYSAEGQPQLFPETLATFRTTFPDCDSGPLSTNLVCNKTASPRDRATALVSLFTLEEVANNTGNSLPGVPRLGLPAYQVWGESLHGVLREVTTESGNYSWATSFPQAILTAASLNRTLFHEIASIIATQSRAFSNAGRFGLDAYDPNINGFRTPLWGRGQETPGEDTFCLTSSYVYEYVTGFQGGIDPTPLKMAATAKHYAGYDLENWEGHSRLGNDPTISPQDLAGYYTPQFRVAADDAKVYSVMCSYNAVNGVPSCANSFLLQTVLRDTFEFPEDGYVTSDCGAVWVIYNPHGYASNVTGAVTDASHAGCDMNCGTMYQKHFVEAVEAGMLSRGSIEKGLIRFYSTLVRLGYFDGNNSSPYRDITWDDVVKTDALNVSYEAAVEGIVLLKNDNNTLPLSSKVRNIALIGPWANATSQLVGNYAGPAPYYFSPLAAFQASGYNVTYELGTGISDNSTAGFAAAMDAASGADAIIFAGGIDNTIEAEGMDRDNVTWPGNQLDLIEQLAGLNKPLVVLQMGGGQVDDTQIKNDNRVGAILWGGYPGQSGGPALRDIITGARAPAGRLVTTQYPADYAYQFPPTIASLQPNGSNPGQTYIWYTGTPVYPFGYGLFYTNFSEKLTGNASSSGCGGGNGSQSTASMSGTQFNISEILYQPHPGYTRADLMPFLNFTASITNTGSVLSDYTAMLFANTSSAGPAPYPNKWLVGFDRLGSVQPGQSQTLTIPVSPYMISRTDASGNRIVYPGTYDLALNNERSVVQTITLTGSPQMLLEWPKWEEEVLPSS